MLDLADLPEGEGHSTANSGGHPFAVNVSYPETVTIRMVDASALGDYEFSLLLAGFFCNAAVGFIVAAITIEEDAVLMWTLSAIFTVVTVMFLVWALIKRRTMNQRAKTVSLASV